MKYSRILSKKLSRYRLNKFLRGEIDKIEPNSSVLSIGAGGQVGNMLLNGADKLNFQLVQIDIDPDKNPDLVADICNWSANEEFDYVFCIEVLEHTKYPRKAIKNIFYTLKSNGILVLSTPFIFPIHDEPYDFFRFTKYGLKDLLSEFKDTSIKGKDSWGHATLVLISRTWKTDNPWLNRASIFIVLLIIILYPFARIVSAIFPSEFYTSGYLVRAIK